MRFKRGYYDVFLQACAKYPSRIAVKLYDEKEHVYKNYTYSELYGVCEYISQNLNQLICNQGVIGLISERNIIIPCVIAAAHKCCTTFMFIDPSQDIETVADNISFTAVITIKSKDDTDFKDRLGKTADKTLEVFGLMIKMYSVESNSSENLYKHMEQHSFIAMTSGSTGEPKHIQVPIQCIQPNINDLTNMFNIVPEDIIYFSTPLTFDPSMVEILLACKNGASLFIAPENAEVLFPSSKENSITFWQTTPSKFFQFPNTDMRHKILSANSTLKVLALGGEPLNGINRLKELKHMNNKTKVYTLYGVTEMSCWACVAELDLQVIKSDREVPLGDCLSETEIIVEPSQTEDVGKIVLVSKTRTCYILNKNKNSRASESLKFVDTGDLGQITNGTIYYRGRKDDVIKRFGHKVNMQLIETTVMQCPKVKTCSCIWLPKPSLLVLYFSSETLLSGELADFLKCQLDDKHWPDRLVRVNNLPVNRHGKISKQLVSKMAEETRPSHARERVKSIFMKEVRGATDKKYSYEQIKDKDFYSIGGSSFLAMTICNRLARVSRTLSRTVLPMLMSSRHTIAHIIQHSEEELRTEEPPPNKIARVRGASSTVGRRTESSTSEVRCGRFVEFQVSWTCDTGKCVDASPTVFQSGSEAYVAVGSHSGRVVVRSVGGSPCGAVCAGARVEAGVACARTPEPCGAVGAHDGAVLCFTLRDARPLWRADLNSMLKSKAVCCDAVLYVAAYDGNLHCLDITTGKVLNKIKISEQGISADLAAASSGYILVGTLGGEIASVSRRAAGVAWRARLPSPVFAAPVLYDDHKYAVFAEVNGVLYCRTVVKGIEIWRYSGAKGNIFSSLYINKVNQSTWQVVFGCFDSHVYSLHIKNFQPILHWKKEMTSPIYCTPCGLGTRFILAASNNGKLSVFEADNGLEVGNYELPDETFSSPVVHGDNVFIGCRDDNLYSLKYTLNHKYDTKLQST